MILDNHTTKNPQYFIMLVFFIGMSLAAALPMFFEVYRTVYYGTMSYDNYARYLLWLLDKPGADLPPSPHVYRLGSVILAAPFYDLPVVRFSGEGISRAAITMSPDYVKALQAMCAANAAYAWMSSCLAGLYLALRRDVPPGWAFAASLVFLLLTRYLGMGSADGIATIPLVITAIAMIERKIVFFAAAVLLGTVVNEKVALIAFLSVSIRALLVPEHRGVYFAMAGIAGIALAAYAATVLTLALPGLDNQRDPGTYLAAMIGSTRYLTSFKGIYQNLWPAIVILILWLASIRQGRDPIVYFWDIGVLIGVFLFAMALDVQYNIGRIVMFTMPLFLLGAVDSLAGAPRRPKPHASGRFARDPASAAGPTPPRPRFAEAAVSHHPQGTS